MKNRLKIAAAALLSASLFCGCIKDIEPTSGATAEQIQGHLDALVPGIPAAMIDIGTTTGMHNDFGYPSLIIARESMGEDFVPAGVTDYNWFNFYSSISLAGWGSTGYNGTQFWFGYYPWIKACNDVIRMAKAREDADAQTYLGIAHAFRAFFYLDLVRTFQYKSNEYTDGRLQVAASEMEKLGVPIVTEETTQLAASNNPRASVDDVYKLIFSDLKIAETNLTDYNRESPTMPNLAVVYGLYARAYLERGALSDENYKLAAEYARKAIGTSGCTPLTQNQWEDPASGFNNYSSQNSWMWCLSQSSNNVGNLQNFISYMSNEQTWGYAMLGEGIAFCVSKALYDRIPDTDFRKHSWIDPNRKYYNYQISYSDRNEFLEKVNHYATIKFRTAGSETNPLVGCATDIPLMRVEEMYLIEAEAAAKASLAEGKRLLTEFMRYRIDDGSYNCSRFTTFEDFQKEVILQKRIEFWGEGLLFFDYKRLGLGVTRSYAETNFPSYIAYNCNKIAPWWNLVIPRAELQNNVGIDAKYNNPDPTNSVSVNN